MKIEPFLMERMQSTWEHHVEINLSESGVHPLTLGELLDDAPERETLFSRLLCYTQTNGTPGLRAEIAAMYAGATIDHVEVTNGGAEANFLVCWSLLDRDDEVVMMVPNYMQAWGLTRAFAGTVHPWPLREGPGPRWAPDLDELRTLVTPRTKLIAICNPNNPTGARLTPSELDAIGAIADKHGAWVHVRRDLPRRRARRPRHALHVGPRGARHHHEWAVEGVRPARAENRLGGCAARDSRVAVVVPRLHDHRARLRSATPWRLSPWRPRAAHGSWNAREPSCAPTTPSSRDGSTSTAPPSATFHRRREPSSTSDTNGR